MSTPPPALPLGLLVARPGLPPAGGCPSAPGFDWDQLAPLYQPQAPGRIMMASSFATRPARFTVC
jgi:hypothetical protein